VCVEELLLVFAEGRPSVAPAVVDVAVGEVFGEQLQLVEPDGVVEGRRVGRVGLHVVHVQEEALGVLLADFLGDEVAALVEHGEGVASGGVEGIEALRVAPARRQPVVGRHQSRREAQVVEVAGEEPGADGHGGAGLFGARQAGHMPSLDVGATRQGACRRRKGPVRALLVVLQDEAFLGDAVEEGGHVAPAVKPDVVFPEGVDRQEDQVLWDLTVEL